MHFAHQLGRFYSYQATAGTLVVQLGSGMRLAIHINTDTHAHTHTPLPRLTINSLKFILYNEFLTFLKTNVLHRYKTFWVNRAGAPLEELGVTPHKEGKTLQDVLTFVKESNSVVQQTDMNFSRALDLLLHSTSRNGEDMNA